MNIEAQHAFVISEGHAPLYLIAQPLNLWRVSLDYRKDPETYVYAKVYDSLVEGRLALEMLRRGLLQNVASKAFMGVKSAVSALVVSNLGKLLEGLSDKDRFWYENVGYSAFTTGLIRIARDLRRIGIDVENVVRIAPSLYRFSYNGFDPNFVDYSEPREVEGDVLEVVEWLLNLNRYFRFDEKLEREREEIRKLLSEFKAV